MFSNLIYFLTALIIYATSELFDTNKTYSHSGWFYSLILGAGFFLICHLSFRRIALNAGKLGYAGVDNAVSAAISRLSILALMVFAVNIYVYQLNAVFFRIPLFELVPTLAAALFLGLFVLYLVIVWNAAFRVQKSCFSKQVSRKSFIVSHLSFSLPALVPWLCLSLFADMVRVIPYSPVKDFFISPVGEIGYILVFLGGMAVFGPVFIKTLWKCRPMEKGFARARIEAVCDKAGLRYADILRWDLFAGSMITAGIMGLVGRYRYILVTPALVSSLEDDEMEAVMLHEIGHVHHHHMLFYLFFFGGFLACNFVFFEPMMLMLFIADPVFQLFAFLGLEKNQVHPVMLCVFLIGFFILYFRIGFGFFMRNFERQADIHLYRFYQDATPLIRTFHKIAALSRQAMDRPNWHHFSIGQRIRFLEQCQKNSALVDRHHRRVRHMITGFVVVLTGVFWLGYSLNYGYLKDGFEDFVARQVVFQQLEADPQNPDLHVLVGDYYYNKHDFSRARQIYENVIRMDKDNVHALNNLSWLLTTCPDEQMRDHERALALATRALSLAREPFVLDTYAEALFANNLVAEALQAAKEALAMADTRQGYYRDQVARFEKHL
ncbi:MAG: M48 family metalloprotease [Desulfotignum sp.]|nr:M48 family metalloprotease [Desulfotignum sp.]